MSSQSLEQAILVSLNHAISYQLVNERAIEERCEEKCNGFFRQQRQC
jgi:hypothetical protein